MNLNTASLTLGIATFRAQTLSVLLSSDNSAGNSFMSIMAGQLQAMDSAATDPLSALTGTAGTQQVTSTGRNMALFDPESAYSMMTEINRRDVNYKAQFSELNQMQSGLATMEDAGLSLGQMTPSGSDESIKSDLQHFVEQYNGWITRFDADLHNGGVLADTRAAQVSQYELEQSVKNSFNGIKDGVYGLNDLGITIDSSTRLASLDAEKLGTVLASNRQGVVDTVQEFSANFSKSADLLNSAGNFMPRQLDNLKRGIQFITDNKSSLQAEFGTGDSAKPSGQIAAALAAYNLKFAA